MREKVKYFIQDNLDLIELNTKEAWEEIYRKLNGERLFTGYFTEVLLDAKIDPVKILQYIPERYLSRSSIEEYNIPFTATIIESCAFCECINLKNIELPNTLTTIREAAFRDCYSLTSIEIPDSVINMRFYSFKDCVSLQKVIISNKLKSIQEDTFKGCDALTQVILGKNIKSISRGAFQASNLKEIIYNNDMSSWQKIKLSKNWRYSTLNKIICTDGIIEL